MNVCMLYVKLIEKFDLKFTYLESLFGMLYMEPPCKIQKEQPTVWTTDIRRYELQDISSSKINLTQ